MTELGIKELLEAGVHFGHQTQRWNPKMRRYIFGERHGIYIIDLTKTVVLLEQARKFAADLAARGGTLLFVGTKKQAKDSIKEMAEASGMPYVTERWLGGLLTNYGTISGRIGRLHELKQLVAEGQLDLLPTKERMSMEAELRKLETNLGGVQHMERLPDAMLVIDLNVEQIAVREAVRLDLPMIGLVDTNCDPQPVDHVIPGNDDALRSCDIVIRAIGEAVVDGRSRFLKDEEERARREAEEQARREAQEAAQREADEKARREAEEKAAEQAAHDEEAAVSAAEPAQGRGTPGAAGESPGAGAPKEG